jgi:hypothetical protein
MQLPIEMVGSGVLFAVRVVGDSMVDASIFDGDYAVIRQQAWPTMVTSWQTEPFIAYLFPNHRAGPATPPPT